MPEYQLLHPCMPTLLTLTTLLLTTLVTPLRHPVHAQLRRACGRGPGFGAAGASGARDALLQLHDLVRKGDRKKEINKEIRPEAWSG